MSGRSQLVSINSFNSDYKTIKYGVTQGFINDVDIAIKHFGTFHFPDDTCVINIKDSVKKINKVVNEDLKFLVQWLNANIIRGVVRGGQKKLKPPFKY